MYLLTETAMGDSMNNEILTLEEVEGLKKELRILSSRMTTAKRKLALEMKLRDAAMSLSRLHSHKSPRNSEDYHTLGRDTVNRNTSDEGLALSNRKCEELAMEIWHLERKVQETQKRLLEHTAGVLQLTHKGLKKNLKNGMPHTPESLSSNNTVDEFDDRSLYKMPDHLTGHGGKGAVPHSQGLDRVSEQQLIEMEAQLVSIMENPGLPRAQSLPPIPDPSSSDVAEHLTYLSVGINGLEDRIEKLLEQKSILTTQIQQQRELNSKSDAERDAHIADLIEQLAHVRKELEFSERQGQQSREDLDRTMYELENAQRQLSEAQEIQNRRDLVDSDKETRGGADAEITRLQGEVARLQTVVRQLEDATESRESAEQQVSQLEETIHQIRNDADIRVKEANDMRTQADAEITRLEESMNQLRAELESQLRDATEARTLAEQNSARLQTELREMESDVVGMRTELTMVKAELDGAYGTRAQRAAEAAANPALYQELDDLKNRNFELTEELANLKAGKPGSGDVHNRVETLEKELRETVDDYEAMTKASIEFEKERERFEGIIDGLRDRCEQLETQINEERISWMGSNNSASSMGRDAPYETTSTMVLKNEFKKMMRDTRTENMKILRAEQEERRKLEAIIRNLKKEQSNLSVKSSLGQTAS
ncbi:involucrin repeat protein [Aspergillus lucknowensis]|uniref:Up-regulated during septation-domain-containing protein n=1 Tax=Aspergillus lucknowensis TaxID=176173 RepID=A0ABR4LPX8_9EURO